MIATLEFRLPREESEFRTAVNAGRWREIVEEFGRWLRNQRKHVDVNELHESAAAYLDTVADEWRSLVADAGVSFDD